MRGIKLPSLAALFVLFVAICSYDALGQGEELVRRSQQVKELMSAGRFEEAIPLCRQLVRALPNNPGLLMNLGMALHMAGHDGEAVQRFETVLKLDPRQHPARLFLGAAYLCLGEPARAIEPLEKLVEAQPDNREAQKMLADAYLSLERYERAAQHYRSLAELNPEDPEAWYGLGLSCENLARRAFDELSEVAPESAYWLELVADSRAKAQQYSSAFYLYRQALAKAPTLRGVHAAIATIYKKTGHPDWAAIEEGKERQIASLDCRDDPLNSPVAQRQSQQAPVSPLEARKLECDFWAGRYRELVASAASLVTLSAMNNRRPAREDQTPIYYWQSRAYNELALEAFSRLSQLPPSVEQRELTARIYRNEGRYLESAKEWREALNLSPGNSKIQKELALSLSLIGDREGALQLLEGLVKREPSSAELNYLLGDTLLNTQKPGQAIPFLKKAVERDSKRLSAQSSLARAYIQIGQAAKAVPHLKAALPADSDGNLHYQLARAYQAAGESQLAGRELKEYQRIHHAKEEEAKTLKEEVQINPPEP
jgi:predicted Zn-dependent protease